ncbi:MAG: ATPase [Paraburkholderia sp.]|uniref:ATPase n=1 Tax=Paraburkholderia sp. TaxID=1926495 RepID=UPI003C5032A6
MLTELETLSQNIGKLIAISQRHNEARQALETQLANVRAESEATRAELAQMREERDALQAERDALSAKIDDAQVRLNAILEKLPRARSHSEPDNQLDLLAPAHESEHGAQHAEEAGSEVTRHGENA